MIMIMDREATSNCKERNIKERNTQCIELLSYYSSVSIIGEHEGNLTLFLVIFFVLGWPWKLKRVQALWRWRSLGCKVKIRGEAAHVDEISGSRGAVGVGRLQHQSHVLLLLMLLLLLLLFLMLLPLLGADLKGVCKCKSTVYQLSLHHCKLGLQRCNLDINATTVS